MHKILSLIGICFILSCGNENKSTADNKNNKVYNKNINKSNFIDTNNSNKKEEITKIKGIIKRAKWFFIFQRGTISVGTMPPENGMRSALKAVLFFVGYSKDDLGNLISVKTLSHDENILKEEVKIEKYDSNNFFTFLELFKLEETVRKKEIGYKDFEPTEGEKYNLILQKEVLNAKNLNDLVKIPFFTNEHIIEEVIKRLKRSDKKFEENIKNLEIDKNFINNIGINKSDEDFKGEIYKIFNEIINEAKAFIPRIKFELIKDYEDSGFIMETTYISNGAENSFSKFFK